MKISMQDVQEILANELYNDLQIQATPSLYLDSGDRYWVGILVEEKFGIRISEDVEQSLITFGAFVIHTWKLVNREKHYD